MIEKKYENEIIPSKCIISGANLKDLKTVHNEIENFIALKMESDSPFANRKGEKVFDIIRICPNHLGYRRFT